MLDWMLDAGCWKLSRFVLRALRKIRTITAVKSRELYYPASSIQHPASRYLVPSRQPREHLFFRDALLDLLEPSGFLQRRIYLSRVGTALAGEVGHAVVDVGLAR